MAHPETMKEFLSEQRRQQAEEQTRLRLDSRTQAELSKERAILISKLPSLFAKLKIELGDAIQDYNAQNTSLGSITAEIQDTCWIGRRHERPNRLRSILTICVHVEPPRITYAIDAGIAVPLRVRALHLAIQIQLGKDFVPSSQLNRVAFYLLRPLL